MRPARRLLLLIALLPFAALAQHRHAHDHKPKHGGLIREAGGFVYELRVTPTEVAVYVTDEQDKPVTVRGSTARVVLFDSGSRTEVVLEPGPDNRFSASGKYVVRPGMGALLDVAVGGASVAKLRYTLK